MSKFLDGLKEIGLIIVLPAMQAAETKYGTELLEKAYTDNPETHKKLCLTLGPGLGLLHDLAAKTSTPIDDAAVNGLLMAVAQSADTHGVEIPSDTFAAPAPDPAT